MGLQLLVYSSLILSFHDYTSYQFDVGRLIATFLIRQLLLLSPRRPGFDLQLIFFPPKIHLHSLLGGKKRSDAVKRSHSAKSNFSSLFLAKGWGESVCKKITNPIENTSLQFYHM